MLAVWDHRFSHSLLEGHYHILRHLAPFSRLQSATDHLSWKNESRWHLFPIPPHKCSWPAIQLIMGPHISFPNLWKNLHISILQNRSVLNFLKIYCLKKPLEIHCSQSHWLNQFISVQDSGTRNPHWTEKNSLLVLKMIGWSYLSCHRWTFWGYRYLDDLPFSYVLWNLEYSRVVSSPPPHKMRTTSCHHA